MSIVANTTTAIDALRDLHPNARIDVRLGSQRYGVTVDARTIVKDYDDAKSDAEHWKAEAEKWQGLAQRLADRMLGEDLGQAPAAEVLRTTANAMANTTATMVPLAAVLATLYEVADKIEVES
jgi:hypothetical protein